MTWLMLAAADSTTGDSKWEALRLLLAVVIVVLFSLITTYRGFEAQKRHPVTAILLTGGWLAVLLGLLVGPNGPLGPGYAVVTVSMIETMKPLIYFMLGWIGLMVGMQAHRDLPKYLPDRSLRIAMRDMVLSVVVIGGAVYLVLDAITPDFRIAIALLVGISSIGWSAETRSLTRGVYGLQPTADLLRATGGLGAMTGVLLYGICFYFIDHGGEEAASFGAVALPTGLLIRIGLALLTALLLGALAYLLTSLISPREEPEFLVVLLGLICIAAGASTTISFAPLFIGMLLGAILINFHGKGIDRFRRVILEAEQNMATALMIVAGVLIEPEIGWAGFWLVVVMLGARLLVKLAGGYIEFVRYISKRDIQELDQRAKNRRFAMMIGPVRQSPLAIAMLIGYTLAVGENGGPAVLSGGRLLMVVILVGVITDIAPLLRFRQYKSPPSGEVEVES